MGSGLFLVRGEEFNLFLDEVTWRFRMAAPLQLSFLVHAEC